MSDERRYREDEIREIFEAAAASRDSERKALGSGEGLTLAELKEIGAEVGLSPDSITQAANALAHRPTTIPKRTHLGMPISVGRNVDLPRAPTDREWEMLVSELRQTFGAKGKVGSHGGLRHWTNGNLHAYVEPTESGHRLRLGSLKSTAMAMSNMGMVGIGFGLVMLVVLFLSGRIASEGFFIPLLFGAMGGAALTSAALTLPGWAREREAQMEYIAGRAVAMLSPAHEGGGSSS